MVVTAQKRSENVQDVPIAISTFSAKTLEGKGVTSVTDLASYAPNVTLENTSPFAGSSQVLSATIRGIGQDDFAFNLEPGVGLYIDGVYFARSLGAVADLLDLDHVEILKGPQGTLFGRNTIGGAISVVTRDPAREFQWQGEATYGDYRRTEIGATVDMPLIEDKLLAQVSLASRDMDGWQKSIPFPGASGYATDLGRFNMPSRPGGSNTFGGQNAQNGRLKLLYEPTDTFKLVLAADFTNVDSEATPYTLLDTASGPTSGTIASIYNTCISLPVATLSAIGLGPICGPRGTVGTALAGANLGPNPRLPFDNRFVTHDIDKTYATGNDFDRERAWGVSATADWKLSDTLKLKSITAYRSLHGIFGASLAGAPLAMSESAFDMSQRQFSQEFQVSEDAFDGRLKNLVGLYYFRETGYLIDYPVFGEGLVQVYGPNFFRNESYAAFAHEHFDVTPKLGITFGARYTDDRKRFEGQQHEENELNIKLGGSPSSYPDPNDLTRLYPLGVNHKTFTNTSIRVGAEYKITDRIMTYVSYSEGFKDGGWTTRLLAPAPGNIAPSFGPEQAKTVEAGLKSELFDHRVRANLAVFNTDYDDLQTTVVDGLSPVFQNAGSARIRGFEAETEAHLISRLSLTANLGYLDAKYTHLDPGAFVTLDDKLPNTPKWSGTVGATYSVDLPGQAQLNLEADYNYKSTMARDAQNSRYLFSGDSNTVNAAATYAASGGAWRLTLGVHNLTDDRTIVTGYDQMSPGQIGFVSAVYSRPRMWYLTLRIKG